MDKSLESFKEKLESVHTFPSLYLFKFIVPEEGIKELKDIFLNHEVILKPSKKGNYSSVTIRIMAGSSDQIISYYEKTQHIKGIISL